MNSTSLSLKRKNHIKRPKTEIIVLTITSIIFALYAFSLLYPLFWALFTSLKSAREYRRNIFGFPNQVIFDNFKKALSVRIGQEEGKPGTSLFGMFINSLWSSLLSTFCSLFIQSMTAYVCTKYKFRAAKYLISAAIVIQALPLFGTMPAMYALCRSLHLLNNPFMYWVVWCGGFGYYFIILCGFYRGLSMDYSEAAFVDGATHAQTYFKIMLPMALPAIFSLFLVSFISSWNNYYEMYLYMSDFPTLSVGLYEWKNIASQHGGNTVYMAALLITVIPVIIVYACFQKQILKQSLGGGLKG